MSDEKPRERIPLPPVLLSVVPWLAAATTATLGLAVFPQLGGVAILLASVAVFAVCVAWLGRRVRRDDT